MNDTSPEIEARFFEMMMGKSGQERMKMGFSMFNMARRVTVTDDVAVVPSEAHNSVSSETWVRYLGYSKKVTDLFSQRAPK